MAFKHYDVVRAASPSDLAERLTQKLKEGWQPFGSPVAITPYTLMQAIAAEGDVSTPVVVTGDDGKAVVNSTTSEPEYYYVIPLAGQSNGMAYGEGLPLPETYDRPDSRIKQLARRSTVTPGGDTCAYNDVIQADHCLHDVQDMSALNHPHADLSKGQYGTVGQGLHIAKKLLPFIPADAGILLVPCCRGGSAFTVGTAGTFSESTGASEDSLHWSVDKPLYQDLLSRTRAALAKNPKNVLLAVVWMQGEGDINGTPSGHSAPFLAMVEKYRADLTDVSGQCVSGSSSSVPWICGDTTYWWKQQYPEQYEAVYGGYKGKEAQNIHFVPFMTDENGVNVPTNNPSEDPDIPASGYYGAASRTSANWTSADRASHFSSWARRGIISDRLATAILTHAGRSGYTTPTVQRPQAAQPDGGATEQTPVISLTSAGGDLTAQGWTVSGTTVTTTENTVTSDGDTLNGNVLVIPKQANTAWSIAHATGDEPTDILNNGGEFFCRFRITDTDLTESRYAFGIYWLPDTQKIPSGATFARTGTGMTPAMLNLYVQTDGTNMNLMAHCATQASNNLKMATFGVCDNAWHTVQLRYHGGGTTRASLTVDGTYVGDLTLTCAPSSTTGTDSLTMMSITSGDTWSTELEQLSVKVNATATAAAVPV